MLSWCDIKEHVFPVRNPANNGVRASTILVSQRDVELSKELESHVRLFEASCIGGRISYL
jgi:hypothetical protein